MQKRDLDKTTSTLTDWLEQQLPAAKGLRVSDLKIPAAGASNETMLFVAEWSEADVEHTADLVLRIQPNSNQLFPKGDVFVQWQMMEAVAKASDVPVPSLRWREEDSSVLGAPFFVMDRVDGEVPNGYNAPLFERLSAPERHNLYENGLAMLARVHRVDLRDGFDFLIQDTGPPGLEGYLRVVDRWYEWAAAGSRLDHIEDSLRYLHENMPKGTQVSLAWGDSRPGNMMFDPVDQHVTAVLDWEIADIATPEVDLGWWLMFERLFADRGEVPPGVMTRDESLTFYESCLGRPLGDIHYFDLLAWTRFALTCYRHVACSVEAEEEAMFKQLEQYVIAIVRGLIDGKGEV